MDEENLEVIPLAPRPTFAGVTIKKKSRITRSSSFVDFAGTVRGAALVRQGVAALVILIFGWYYPRYLIAHADYILLKRPPYQKTESGDVIVDFLLAEPLVDPPTIPCLFGFLTAIGLSEGSTQLLKLFIQRKRPNYYDLCGWDATILSCTGPDDMIKEANFSFPSGHSSLACCGMTFLVWFCLGKIVQSTFVTKRILALCTCVVLWGWALFVAASRLVDHWHHPADVVAGLLLGGFMSTIAYHVWYPPIWWTASNRPWSMLLAEDYVAPVNTKSPSSLH